MRITIAIVILSVTASLFSLLPSREFQRHPDDFGFIYKSLEAVSTDSLRIASWFFPAQEMPTRQTIINSRQEGVRPEYRASEEPQPTIVVANGDAGNMGNQINFVVGFCPVGYNVVLFDWRGFGASDDWPTDRDHLAYTEYIDDYLAILDAVFEQPEVDTTRVALYGGSTGAYLSFAAAQRDMRVSACVLRALLTSFDDVLPILRAKKPDRDLKAPEVYPPKLLPINIAPSFDRPVMLIVGGEDEVTPVWMSKHIYELLPGKKELWIVPDATHGGENGPVYSDFGRFVKRVDQFLHVNLGL